MKDLTLKELLKDLKEFDKDYWVAPAEIDGATRHITLHLAKLMGKMGEVTERREHGMKPSTEILEREVIPDLLIYALRLADLYGLDLQQAYFSRQDFNRKRVKSWADPNQKDLR